MRKLNEPFSLGEPILYTSKHAMGYLLLLNEWRSNNKKVDPFHHLAFYLRCGKHSNEETERHAHHTTLAVNWIHAMCTMWPHELSLDEAASFLQRMRAEPELSPQNMLEMVSFQ